MKPAFLIFLATNLGWSAATTVALEPVADTFISAQDPDGNFGTAAELQAAFNARVALLRFDLTSVPQSAVVSSVRLTLAFDVPKDQPHDSGFTVCDLAKEFNETQATYRQAAQKDPWYAPGLKRFSDYGAGSLAFCSDPIRIQGPGTASANLTNFVRMAIYTHRKSVNLAVFSGQDSFAPGAIYSRRAPDPANRPKLEVVFDAAAPKAVTNHPFLQDKFGSVMLDASESAKPDGSKKDLQYLWSVDRPAPGSTNSPGQELGREIKLKFDPDVSGSWSVRLRVTDAATKAFSETTIGVTDILLAPHPRLGLNADLLARIKTLQTMKNSVWVRFEDWLKKPADPKYGSQAQGLLLGYAVTKNRAYFDAAWKLYIASIYVNGRERSDGIKPFFGQCGKALYCDDHAAASIGGDLCMQISVLYDWGFDALTGAQRGDLMEWLNAANDFNFHANSAAHSHFSDDGIAITLGLAASAYATYGENRNAMLQMSWFRQEWEHTLQALDIMGVGGAPGGAVGSHLTVIANDVLYASGENLFLSHPYFRRHLAYTAFSTPTRAPQLRSDGLALSRRFPGSEEAEVFNWVFRQKDSDQSEDPFVDVLFYSPPPPLTKPKRLSFFDPGMGNVYTRSDWNGPDATWISSSSGPHFDAQQRLNDGSFTLTKRRDLAIETGNATKEPVTPHFLSYYSRTVSGNSILIGDPNEYFSGFIGNVGCDGLKQHDLFPAPDGSGKVCLPNDGGQRTMSPYSMELFSNEEFLSHRSTYDTAKIVSFADNGLAVAWVADITNAYSNPLHTAPLNKPKVTKVYRKFVYLREADVLLVADTVQSASRDLEKSCLIHAADRIEVAGTDRARIVANGAALQLKTLFPAKCQYRLIQTDDHSKDFWVKDYSEGVQPDHRSLNWPPAPPISPGYGRSRLEIQPAVPAKNDYFLNVLKPTLETTDNMPEVTKFDSADTFGASFTTGGKSYKVTFTKETPAAPVIDGMDMQAPVLSNGKPANQVPAGTRQTPISVTTNEPAACRFSVIPGVAFSFMTGVFQTTDGLTHITVNRDLNNGDTYTYFVRCADKSGNENLEDLRITFSVAH